MMCIFLKVSQLALVTPTTGNVADTVCMSHYPITTESSHFAVRGSHYRILYVPDEVKLETRKVSNAVC